MTKSNAESACTYRSFLPEVVRYPDSNKIGTMAFRVSAVGERERVIVFLRHEPVDYWEGEKPK